MRKTVEIVGIGKRKCGTSRKGNSYDMVPVSFLYHDKDTNGQCAATVNVDGEEYDRSGITVGEVRDFIMHEQNFSLRLDAIL